MKDILLTGLHEASLVEPIYFKDELVKKALAHEYFTDRDVVAVAEKAANEHHMLKHEVAYHLDPNSPRLKEIREDWNKKVDSIKVSESESFDFVHRALGMADYDSIRLVNPRTLNEYSDSHLLQIKFVTADEIEIEFDKGPKQPTEKISIKRNSVIRATDVRNGKEYLAQIDDGAIIKFSVVD